MAIFSGLDKLIDSENRAKEDSKKTRWIMKKQEEKLIQQEQELLSRGYCPYCNLLLTTVGECPRYPEEHKAPIQCEQCQDTGYFDNDYCECDKGIKKLYKEVPSIRNFILNRLQEEEDKECLYRELVNLF